MFTMYTIELTKAGYNDLVADIDVAEAGVSCLSVTGGLCGSSTPPGVIASNFLVTGYLLVDICTWITGLGGWEAITSMDALDLLKARLGIIDLGFTVTSVHRLGVLNYRLDDPVNGDYWTGCRTP